MCLCVYGLTMCLHVCVHTFAFYLWHIRHHVKEDNTCVCVCLCVCVCIPYMRAWVMNIQHLRGQVHLRRLGLTFTSCPCRQIAVLCSRRKWPIRIQCAAQPLSPGWNQRESLHCHATVVSAQNQPPNKWIMREMTRQCYLLFYWNSWRAEREISAVDTHTHTL